LISTRRFRHEEEAQSMPDSNFKIKLRTMLFASGVSNDELDRATDIFLRRFRNSFGDFYDAVDDNGKFIERGGERYSPERYLTELRAGHIGSESERKFFSRDLANAVIRSASGFTETQITSDDMNKVIRSAFGLSDE
jgi:hypothetical protein